MNREEDQEEKLVSERRYHAARNVSRYSVCRRLARQRKAPGKLRVIKGHDTGFGIKRRFPCLPLEMAEMRGRWHQVAVCFIGVDTVHDFSFEMPPMNTTLIVSFSQRSNDESQYDD
ncbi:hypothetical protein EYF80_043556 [Liparis tanakae]|uniref:Uncharacterized protein n=1 Tax=Liparis tanakae TaxID=230148 RepID=A0A4Z2G028_9TELE|nr:hypothetical protein EYF80_043556 [Liparis tanakae]